MVRLKKFTNAISQEDGPKTRRTIHVLGPLTYQLKLLETWKIHDVFHASLLQQYRENNVYGTNYDHLPAKLNNERQEVYNIETILKYQRQG